MKKVLSSLVFLITLSCTLLHGQIDSEIVIGDTIFVADTFSLESLGYPIKSDNLTLVFIGDIMGHDAQIQGAWDDSSKNYNYEPTFRYISDYISSADLAIGNLEVTLAGPPYKGYPQFSSPDALAIEAQKAGIDIMVTANNHALDGGSKGMVRTHHVLDSLGFLHTGTFLHDSLRSKFYPLIVEKNNIRLALLNYTYGTNGLKVAPPVSINRIDTAVIKADLAKAKLAEPDYIIAVMHWGVEYERSENAVQDRLARFIFKNGADAIIGSHPHVVQPIKNIVFKDDSLRENPVYYSMGNFVSNQRAQYKDGGIMAELHLSRKDSLVVLDSAAWLPYWVYREDINSQKSTFYVLPVPKYEADTGLIQLDAKAQQKLNRFAKDTRSLLKKSPILESTFYRKPENHSGLMVKE